MRKWVIKHWGLILLVLSSTFSFGVIFFISPVLMRDHYVLLNIPVFGSVASTTKSDLVEEKILKYMETPSEVKGIYMTSWIASGKSLRDSLVKLIESTELNSIVVDIKDYSGKIVFNTNNEDIISRGSIDVRIKDLPEFIEELHDKGIYVIGRVAVFQDAYFVKIRPDLAVKNKAGDKVWKDRKGISWIDPGSKEYWDYIVIISKEARKIGFDEINFDYIRFPSDGNMLDISYPWSSTTPKSLVLKDFFEYLNKNLSGTGLKTSADLFGMTTTETGDMGIGQILENALPYFDYISPMVYPSHYSSNYEGFSDPEEHPYEIVNIAMKKAVERATLASSSPSKLRPWLQDFGLRKNYGAKEVLDQIRATNDAGLRSWLLWSPSNKYTKGALAGE